MEYEFAKPSLVEPGIKYFINETLGNCSRFKKKYYSDMINIITVTVVVCGISAFLYYKYKGKPTPMDRLLKEREKRHYVLSRIKNYQDDRRKVSQENITGLPNWENEYSSPST